MRLMQVFKEETFTFFGRGQSFTEPTPESIRTNAWTAVIRILVSSSFTTRFRTWSTCIYQNHKYFLVRSKSTMWHYTWILVGNLLPRNYRVVVDMVDFITFAVCHIHELHIQETQTCLLPHRPLIKWVQSFHYIPAIDCSILNGIKIWVHQLFARINYRGSGIILYSGLDV